MGRPKADCTRQKRKTVKDPNRPKRAMTAWFLFMQKKREEAHKNGEDISRVALFTKRVAEIWRGMGERDKVPFEEMAATDKARYTKEMALYKGKTIDPDKPKRPQSAYFLWLGEFRIQNKHKYGHKELLSKAGESWNSLSEDDKLPWNRKAEVERQKYEERMRTYNAKKATAAAPPMMQRMQGASQANNGAAEYDEEDDDDEDDDEEYEDDE